MSTQRGHVPPAVVTCFTPGAFLPWREMSWMASCYSAQPVWAWANRLVL